MSAEAETEEIPAAIANAVNVLWQHQPEMTPGLGTWGCTSHTAKSQCRSTFDTYDEFLIHQVEVLANSGIRDTETVRQEVLEEAAEIAQTALTEQLRLPASTAAEVAEQIRKA